LVIYQEKSEIQKINVYWSDLRNFLSQYSVFAFSLISGASCNNLTDSDLAQDIFNHCKLRGKRKEIPEGSSMLRLPDFMTAGTWSL